MFQVEKGPTRLYDFDDNVQLVVTYELDRDLRIIRRNVYTFLDLLGEIGGLSGALISLFSAFVIIFRYRAFIGYMSNETFLIKDGDEVVCEKKERSAPKLKKLSSSGGLRHTETLVYKQIPGGFFASIKLSF